MRLVFREGDLDGRDRSPCGVRDHQRLSGRIKLRMRGRRVDGDGLRREVSFLVEVLHIAPWSVEVLGGLNIETPHVRCRTC